jgi:flagellar basal body-associated protein FliL
MINRKGLSGLAWTLIILLLVIGLAAGAYFVFSGSAGIPQPPALPSG